MKRVKGWRNKRTTNLDQSLRLLFPPVPLKITPNFYITHLSSSPFLSACPLVSSSLNIHFRLFLSFSPSTVSGVCYRYFPPSEYKLKSSDIFISYRAIWCLKLKLTKRPTEMTLAALYDNHLQLMSAYLFHTC